MYHGIDSSVCSATIHSWAISGIGVTHKVLFDLHLNLEFKYYGIYLCDLILFI